MSLENQTINVLKNHTSIRQFTDQAIEKEQRDLIIDCAMRGATAGNMMMYHIIEIDDRDLLIKLGETCDNQPFIGKAAFALLFVVDNHKWDRVFKLYDIPEAFPDYKGPEISDFILGMQDAMIAAQNAVIAAESLGLGTCYIGDIIEHAEAHRELLHLPHHTMPATLIVFGHYKHKPLLRDRFSKEYVVSQNQYKPLSDDAVKDMYGKMTKEDIHRFFNRKIHADFFKEMIRSIKVYLKDWRI